MITIDILKAAIKKLECLEPMMPPSLFYSGLEFKAFNFIDSEILDDDKFYRFDTGSKQYEEVRVQDDKTN